MAAKLEPLFEIIGALRELGVSVVWLTPIPRTLMKRGVLAGEKDVKVSYWRVRRWAHQLGRLMQARGVSVVDSLHAASALPEAFDGNHLGIACGWAAPGEWIGTHAGRAGVCRLNGRLLARTVLNIILGGICPAAAPAERQLVRILPTHLDPSTADVMVPGLVRHLRVSLLDGRREAIHLPHQTQHEGNPSSTSTSTSTSTSKRVIANHDGQIVEGDESGEENRGAGELGGEGSGEDCGEGGGGGGGGEYF